MINLKDVFSNNQFFSGGFVLMILGSLVAMARNIPQKMYEFLKNKIIFTCSFSNNDPIFYWLRHWIESHPDVNRKRTYRVEFKKSAKFYSSLIQNWDKEEDVPDVEIENKKDQEKVPLAFFPEQGTYFLRHKGKIIWLEYSREKNNQTTSNNIGGADLLFSHHETITIICLGKQEKCKKFVQSIIEECYQSIAKTEENKTKIFVEKYHEWKFLNIYDAVKPSFFIYKKGLYESLEEDVKTFFSKKRWYQSMGIPWRRGYLLYGPAGGGKSSLVKCIAGQFRLDIYSMTLSGVSVDFTSISSLFRDCPENSILLIEDIDSLFKKRKQQTKTELTFSGFINALDGVGSTTGRLLFMTTNLIDVLDPALIRPGRADVHLLIDDADEYQKEMIYLKFFPNKEREAKQFRKLSKDIKCSMAILQEHLLRYHHDFEGALHNIALLTERSLEKNIKID